MRAGGVRGRRAHRVVPEEGATRVRIVGDALELGIGRGAHDEPALEAAGEVVAAASEERAHVARAREVHHVEVAAGAVVAREHACPHHHVVAAAGRRRPHVRHLVGAGIEDERAGAVRLLEPRLHRRAELDVDPFDAAAPRRDRRAHVDDEAPRLPRDADVLTEPLHERVHDTAEGGIGAVLRAEHGVDDLSGHTTGLGRSRQRAGEDQGKAEGDAQRDGSHDRSPHSAASGRTPAASQLTPTRAPTSSTPRRVGS